MFIQAGRHRTRALALVTITALGAALWGIASGDGAGAVGINPATVTVTSSANPSVNGQTVTFTATVTGSSGVPTGKVTPYKNGSSQSSVTLDAQGRASWSTTFSPGTATISATYKGSSVYAVATSPTLTQTITPAPTTTVVTSSANPSVVGASVTLTATNTAVAPGTCTIDSGTVNFYDGSTKIGSKSASSGKAAISITTLARGPHAITATFPATSKCLGSTSAVTTQTVAPHPTTTTALASSANPSISGQSVTFTATVTGGSGTPSGTVTFTDGAATLGTAPLAFGQAVLSTSSLGIGMHTITATYGGDATSTGSASSPLTQTVTGVPTSTALTSDVNPSTAGQSVTFTATVTGGSGTPGGTVTFTDGTSTLGTGALAAGQATLTTSALAPGTHAVTATYGGDTTSTGSTSTPLTQNVNASAANVLFVDKANPSCTNSGTGAGTSATPFCAINSAAAKATAGVTVVVAAGTYNEKVTVTNSGTASAPITFTTAPGATVTVSGGSNGFSISTKSWVIIHGFTVTTTTGVGITVSSSTNITIDGNRVTNAGLPVSGSTATGIKLNTTTASTVSNNTTDHNSDAGVYVTTDSNGNTIRNNVSFANARGYVRAAAGFDLRNSTGNVVYGNISHDNEDSGFNVWTGTTWGSNLVDDNVAYANGDHGIDVHNAVDARIISNTVSGNYDSGIEMTTSIGSLLANNISVDNGMNSVRTSGNIRADSASVSGGSSVNDDLVSLSTPGVMVDWGGVKYASLAAFQAATGQELRGIEAIPRFVNGPGADFHLLAGSPAIDAADTAIATEPAVDFDGTARVDDPATVDTGIGPVTYADRGAFEYRP